jgi:formate hydrogenlyase subunit 3/multisubunit Na+/H+ antiporter MnhD subunit
MNTRSGVKSTEFWITAVVAVLGMIGPTLLNMFGSEESLPDWAKTATQIAGAGLAALAAMGYTVARSGVKKAQLDAQSRDTEARATVKATEVDAKAQASKLLSLFLCIALVGGFGCAAPVVYDPMTVGQIDATIGFEEADFALSKKAMEACGADVTEIRSLEVRHDAELVRLQAWRQAERAKALHE